MMSEFVVSTSQGQSRVYIDFHLFSRIPRWLPGKRAFILADEFLGEPAERLKSILAEANIPTTCVFLPGHETSKSFEFIYPLYTQMLNAGLERTSVLLALGGGVIGDIGGFLAGTYLRGIPWVGIPSTLLAQVDSAIGGKTGINHPSGKNLIGVFHHPNLVVCDLSLLRTLPAREMISGLGEMIKYALLEDENFFSWLEAHWASILNQEPEALKTAVTTCLLKKSKYIEQDEFDQKGTRELLNFGHTLGHALEAATEYNYFRHGEAVIWGMRAALYLSHEREILTSEKFHRIDTFLAQLPIPEIPPSISFDRILQAINMDKKKTHGRIRWILLENIGHPVICENIPIELIIKSFI